MLTDISAVPQFIMSAVSITVQLCSLIIVGYTWRRAQRILSEGDVLSTEQDSQGLRAYAVFNIPMIARNLARVGEARVSFFVVHWKFLEGIVSSIIVHKMFT
jgi:hypothetical protein